MDHTALPPGSRKSPQVLGPEVLPPGHSWMQHLLHGCLAPAPGNIQAWFLYTLAYSCLLNGDRILSCQILHLLENLEENLSALLVARLRRKFK